MRKPAAARAAAHIHQEFNTSLLEEIGEFRKIPIGMAHCKEGFQVLSINFGGLCEGICHLVVQYCISTSPGVASDQSPPHHKPFSAISNALSIALALFMDS